MTTILSLTVQSSAAFPAKYDAFKARWIAANREAVAGEYTDQGHDQRAMNSLTYLATIKTVDAARKTFALLTVDLLHEAFAERYYADLGFNNIFEWLNSWDIENRGRFNQLLRVAIEVLPWCLENGVKVGGEFVTMDWLRQKPNGVCRASRAVAYVALHRQITAIPPRNDDERALQVEAVSTALSAVANGDYSQAALRDNFKALGDGLVGDPHWNCDFRPIEAGGYSITVIVENKARLGIFREMSKDFLTWD